MIEELLKIIFTADKLIPKHSAPFQDESTQLIASCIHELEEMEEEIHQHFLKGLK